MGTILLNGSIDWSDRVMGAGFKAFGAWVRALAWCSSNGQGLVVPKAVAKTLAPGRLWGRLAKFGMVERVPEGWRIVNFECGRAEPAFRLLREDWSKFAVDAVYARDGGHCRYCGADSNLSIDHVIPKSKGGPDCASNLVVACRSCNSRKGARTPEQAGMTLLPIGDA